VIDNELRKEKQLTRRYQVATERLMQFVEVVMDTDIEVYHSFYLFIYFLFFFVLGLPRSSG